MASREDRLPVLLLAALPGLAAQFGWRFLRYQARRRRGVREFRRALLLGNMPPERVEPLVQAYHDIGSVRRILGGFR